MSYFLTQCPFCRIFFKVSEDQMHAANGAVRCGFCMEVFLADQHRIILKEKATHIDKLIHEYDAPHDRLVTPPESNSDIQKKTDLTHTESGEADDSNDTTANQWDDETESEDLDESASHGTDIDWDEFDEPAFGDGLTDSNPDEAEEDEQREVIEELAHTETKHESDDSAAKDIDKTGHTETAPPAQSSHDTFQPDNQENGVNESSPEPAQDSWVFEEEVTSADATPLYSEHDSQASHYSDDLKEDDIGQNPAIEYELLERNEESGITDTNSAFFASTNDQIENSNQDYPEELNITGAEDIEETTTTIEESIENETAMDEEPDDIEKAYPDVTNIGTEISIDIVESSDRLTVLPAGQVAANDIDHIDETDPDLELAPFIDDDTGITVDIGLGYDISDFDDPEDTDYTTPLADITRSDRITTLIPDQTAMEANPVCQELSPGVARIQAVPEGGNAGASECMVQQPVSTDETDKSELLENLSTLTDEHSPDLVTPDSLQSIWEEPGELGSFRKPGSPLKIAALLLTSTLMVLALAAQYLWFNLDVLVIDREWPQITSQLCRFRACPDPDALDLSVLVTEELVVRSHPETRNALLVDFIFRNDAPREQPLPLVELTFKDSSGSIMASRAFSAQEYLPREMILLNTIPAHSSIQISLALVNPGPEATSYALAFLAP